MAPHQDQQPEKVPTNLHVRYLTLISHCGWREALALFPQMLAWFLLGAG